MIEYGCIGESLKHSFSAEIHSKLFGYKYQLCEVKKSDLDSFMKRHEFKAINVTIPYKQDVIPYLYEIDETAKQIGAVNTVVNRDGRLYGYNTDFSGLGALIIKNGIELKGKKVLIAGSGGTSKTALAVAKSMKAAEVYRISRHPSDSCISYDDAYNLHGDADVIINTTPCGMFPNIGNVPLETDRFEKLSAVVDAVYNPLRSMLTVEAQKKGIKAAGGLYMLVSQAAFAAEKFVGEKVPDGKIQQIYSDILKSKENIVLIGMPGCGKSTVGKIISEKTGKRFADTDLLITERAGMTIPEYFKKFGEASFRNLESEVIKELSAEQSLVIATGGGAVINSKNADLLKENGRLYFIDRPLECLAVSNDRPLSSNKTDLERLYKQRYSVYLNCADKKIDGNGTPQKNAELILKEFSA